jgi:hypothetical protein
MIYLNQAIHVLRHEENGLGENGFGGLKSGEAQCRAASIHGTFKR